MSIEERRLFLKQHVVCPHCNLYSANDKICTNLGCGKRLAAPVRLFARTRKRPTVIRKAGKLQVKAAKVRAR